MKEQMKILIKYHMKAIKELKTIFFVLKGKNSEYHLFDRNLNKSETSGLSFFGSFVKNKFLFNNKEFTDLNLMIEEMKIFNSKLIHPICIVNPLSRIGYNDESIIRYELEKAGFKWNHGQRYYGGDYYTLTHKVLNTEFELKLYIDQYEDDSRWFSLKYVLGTYTHYEILCLGGD